MKIFCDLDGVLVDFVAGCKESFNWPVHDHAPLNDVRAHLNISTELFWNTIDKGGEEWWVNLPKEEWADELVTEMLKYDKNFTILTSPSLSHFAASGKVLWLQKYFSKRFKNYIITPAHNKCLLANKKSVLIDDNDRNCEQFQEKLGYTILVPQIWNKNYDKINTRMAYIKDQLKIISQYI